MNTETEKSLIIYKKILNKINSQLLMQNHGDQEAAGQHIQNAERKSHMNQELYIQQNFKMKDK